MGRKPPKTSAADDRVEWGLAALASVVVLGLFTFLAFEAVSKPDAGPVIRLEIASMEEVAGATYVDVKVTNFGTQAAADVGIEGEVEVEGEVQTADATLDYAPPGSDAQVTLVFATTVTATDVQLRVIGFREP